MHTTLNAIRAHGPCESGWRTLLKSLGKIEADDEPLSIVTVLDSNGLDDALWCLRAVEGHDREKRLYAVQCVRQIQHMLTDQRSRDALDVAERFANGRASREELDAAQRAAAYAAAVARTAYAAYAAAYAADATDATAYVAAREQARATQASELRRVCAAIDAGHDPYPYPPAAASES